MTDTETRKKKVMGIIKGVIPYLVIILIVLFIRAYVVIPIRVNGDSMAPTLEMNEFMILNRLAYRNQDLNRFDIVVIQYGDRPLIKRIIGLPGETVEYRDKVLYINGEAVEETFERGDTEDYNITEHGFVNVPDNQVFAIGDNRENSIDSRHLGFFNKNVIIGKANFVLFPISDWGRRE